MFDIEHMADDKSKNKKMIFKILPIFMIIMMLLMGSFISIPIKTNAWPSGPAIGVVHFVQSQSQFIVRDNIDINDGYPLEMCEQFRTTSVTKYGNTNPASINTQYWLWAGAYNFYPAYGNDLYYRQSCTGTYFTQYDTYVVPTNATILYVNAEIVGYENDIPPMNKGWFSVSNSTLPNWQPWGFDPFHIYSDSLNQNNSQGVGIFNSTILTPYHYAGYGSYSYWNITSLYAWTVPMIFNNTLNIWWNTAQNTSGGHKIDYVGLSFKFVSGWYEGEDLPDEIIDPDFENNFNSIIWLLIVFAPALSLQFMLPKIGYAFGMFISLIIFGFTQPNFMYVTVIGIASLGIMLYKGD